MPDAEIVARLRSSIGEQLTLLSDPEAQRQYERNVPIADVSAELFCGWFDDLYHPESPAFRAAFSPRELEDLAEFNEVFIRVAAELPEPLPRLCDLQAHPAWGCVVSGAARALERLTGRNI